MDGLPAFFCACALEAVALGYAAGYRLEEAVYSIASSKHPQIDSLSRAERFVDSIDGWSQEHSILTFWFICVGRQ